MIDIIPAIDIMDGKAVRLSQGSYDSKRVYGEPVEMLKEFEGNGIRRLHVVDLDGAKAGKLVNLRTLEQLAKKTSLLIDYSGGIKTEGDVSQVFNAGAALVSVGTMAVKDAGEVKKWIQEYGGEKFLIGADVKNERIAIRGWQEESSMTVFELIREFMNEGVHGFFCTDISKDGMMAGPGIQLYKSIVSNYPGLNLIASGGVRNMDDVRELERIGCQGVIVGKALYEGNFFLC